MHQIWTMDANLAIARSHITWDIFQCVSLSVKIAFMAPFCREMSKKLLYGGVFAPPATIYISAT